MYHLIYLSSALSEMSEARLEDLLSVARRNNLAAGVTGMLLYLDGNFIQYLEGDEPVVRRIFDKIESDPRHHGVIVVDEGKTDRRLFDDWAMGFRRMDRRADDEAGLFDLTRQALSARVPPDFPRAVRTFMEHFYRANSPGR
jgi:Sensors of blue-light using FAD